MFKSIKHKFAIYPFLLCLLPILTLYSENIDQVEFTLILLPSAVMLIFTLLLLLLAGLIVKDSKKAVLITAIFLVLFFSFGHVSRKIGIWEILNISNITILLIVWILLFITGIYFTLKTGSDLSFFTKASNAILLSLIAVLLFNITIYQAKKIAYRHGDVSSEIPDTAPSIGKDAVNRDIYYIILDAYADSETLEKIYGFNNHEFTDYLSEKGFYIAPQSRSNYSTTFLSLASSLNMNYVNNLSDPEEADSRDRDIPYEMIKENKVASFLKKRGYMFIHFSSGWGATAYNKSADMDFRFGWGNEFLMVLIKTTLLACFEGYIAEIDNRERILLTFSKLAELHRIKGPKFIFAHIPCPHPPYIFNSEGGKAARIVLEMDEGEWQKKQLYTDQLIFINIKVKEVVDKILKESGPPPIIVIQADHGSASLGRPHPPLQLADTRIIDQVRERTGILNAYYLPDGGSDVLYGSITPVNTFRSIFDFYFGSGYGLLKDRIYYGDYDTPYVLTDVTEAVAPAGITE